MSEFKTLAEAEQFAREWEIVDVVGPLGEADCRVVGYALGAWTKKPKVIVEVTRVGVVPTHPDFKSAVWLEKPDPNKKYTYFGNYEISARKRRRPKFTDLSAGDEVTYTNPAGNLFKVVIKSKTATDLVADEFNGLGMLVIGNVRLTSEAWDQLVERVAGSVTHKKAMLSVPIAVYGGGWIAPASRTPDQVRDDMLRAIFMSPAMLQKPKEIPRFPHVCRCGAKGYASATSFECSAGCKSPSWSGK